MKYREDTRAKMDIRAKIFVIASIIISFFVILIPVWQKGITRSSHYEILLSQEKIERMEEEERNLIAFILEKDTYVDSKVENLVAGV